MDKVLVLGALDELGFQMTSSLLEEGYEVCGILHPKGEDALYDERRLRIGRNANFKEIQLMEWLEDVEETKGPAVFFVNCLDNENGILLLEEQIGKRIIGKLQTVLDPCNSSIIFIQPLSDWKKKYYKLPIKSGKVTYFFVPTLNEVYSESREYDCFASIFKAIIEVSM